MSGRPTFTIVLSRPTMNRLMQQTASIRPRRPRPVAGGGTGAAAREAGRAGRGAGGAGRGAGVAAGRGRAPTARPGYGSGAEWPAASSRPRTDAGFRSGSRAGTLSDLRWVDFASACIVRTPQVVLAPGEYRLLMTRPALDGGSGPS